MHSGSHRLAIRNKVWLEAGRRFLLGDGGIELLQAIQARGSLRAASAHVGWSYRHALTYLTKAEAALGYRLVRRVRGGDDRGGAVLTAEGRDFLRRYTLFRRRLNRSLYRLYQSAFGTRLG